MKDINSTDLSQIYIQHPNWGTAVRKSDVLNDYEVCRYMQLENGLHADVYALEIIIPVAFRVNTYNTHLFRTWLVGKALSQEKRQTYVMFIQNGKAGYC